MEGFVSRSVPPMLCYVAEEKKQLFFLEFVSYEMIAYINVLASPMKFRIFNKLDSWSSYPRKDSL